MTTSDNQFQIGDFVLYVHEGVFTQVQGYLWVEAIGALPVIGGYVLECGITVPKDAIVWSSPAARHEARKL